MENLTQNTQSQYITPSKANPVFVAMNSYFGRIEDNLYKEWYIESLNTCGTTFATSFADAVNRLHEWIVTEKDYVNGIPSSEFYIEMIDGSLRKDGDYAAVKVYSITTSKAKKLLF